MAVLTVTELAKIRRALSRGAGVSETWVKAEVNAASQAIEDRLQSSKPTLNADIETAAPGVFNNTQKRLIFANAAVRFALGEGV